MKNGSAITIIMGALSNASVIEWVQAAAGIVSIVVGLITIYKFYKKK